MMRTLDPRCVRTLGLVRRARLPAKRFSHFTILSHPASSFIPPWPYSQVTVVPVAFRVHFVLALLQPSPYRPRRAYWRVRVALFLNLNVECESERAEKCELIKLRSVRISHRRLITQEVLRVYAEIKFDPIPSPKPPTRCGRPR
jgi:hypothetical protein